MQIMSVSAFVQYLNDTFKAIWDSEEVAIEGEVNGYRVSQGQWATFDLKDQDALVNIFLPLWRLSVPVQDGMRTRVFGFPRVYPKYGKFSFQAERVELVGDGSLRKALALVREKLVKEGLFDTGRKRPLPKFPERIALIASRESAAYGDFVRIVNERWSGLAIDVYHVFVQGERAVHSMVDAIERVQASDHGYDVLVLTRGGGSLEELMAFNDERLVRALYASRIPTLVGIGHERDITLAEEVADVRASTPTDCARRLVPDRTDILSQLAQREEQIRRFVDASFEAWRERVDRALVQARHWHQDLEHRLTSLTRVLSSCDPRNVVQRGYAIVRDTDGRVVTSIFGLSPGKRATLDMRDGRVDTQVASVYAKKEKPF